jgi:hypothetical protein
LVFVKLVILTALLAEIISATSVITSVIVATFACFPIATKASLILIERLVAAVAATIATIFAVVITIIVIIAPTVIVVVAVSATLTSIFVVTLVVNALTATIALITRLSTHEEPAVGAINICVTIVLVVACCRPTVALVRILILCGLPCQVTLPISCSGLWSDIAIRLRYGWRLGAWNIAKLHAIILLFIIVGFIIIVPIW